MFYPQTKANSMRTERNQGMTLRKKKNFENEPYYFSVGGKIKQSLLKMWNFFSKKYHWRAL